MVSRRLRPPVARASFSPGGLKPAASEAIKKKIRAMGETRMQKQALVGHPNTEARKPFYRVLYVQVLIGVVLGVLTAAVLYQYGTGPVQGFAVTLIAGIVASLFTAIFVVRTFYLLWLSRSRGAQTLSI